MTKKAALAEAEGPGQQGEELLIGVLVLHNEVPQGLSVHTHENPK